jgi:predicted permease
MNPLMRALNKLRLLIRRDRFADELQEEMAFHREQKARDLEAAGLEASEARYAANRAFGNAAQLADRSHDVVGLWFETILQDFRFALRQLRKNAGFAFTAIAMLAIGLCASVSIFAFVDAALIKPLPYENPSRLVGVYEWTPQCPLCNLSYPDYLDWKKLNRSFDSLELYQHSGGLLATSEGVEQANASRVSDGFFRALGVVPLLGRDFYAGEDLLSAPRTVLLSYSAWQKRYGGRSDVLGQTVTIDNNPTVIVGVLPADFHFPPAEPADFWTSIHASSDCDLRRSCHGFYGVARLLPGVSVQNAVEDTKSIANQLAKLYPLSNTGQSGNVALLTEVIVGNVRSVFLMLLCGAGLLLVIAGVNIASLLLVRAESRKREIAIRNALGAARLRLLRQFVTEGLVLVAAGTGLGLLASYWMMRVLLQLIPSDMVAQMSFLRGMGLNFRVVAFAVILALLAAVLFSVTPAMHLFSSEIRGGLAEGSRGSAGTTWRRLGAKLVAVELATAVVLLVAAGLLGRSFVQLLQVNIGLQPENLATLQVSLPSTIYPKDPEMISVTKQIVEQAALLPGVKSAAISSDLPINGWGDTTWFRVIGRPWHGEHYEVAERDVSPTYFATLGSKLIRGRYFREEEDASKPRVAIINQAMAREYFPGEDPLTKQLTNITHDIVPMQIVGIVEDIQEGQLDSENRSALYLPFNQSPGHYFNVVVRTSKSEASIFTELASAIRQINHDIGTSGAASMTQIIHDSPSAYVHRSSAWLVGGFAGVALLLGVVGLYGVVAYSVSQRTREIGVRIAMGAQRGSVYRLILREAGRLIFVGLGIGLMIALGAATLMRGLLFGVRWWDPLTLTGVTVLLATATLLASFIPARRAASVDPVNALRAE